MRIGLAQVPLRFRIFAGWLGSVAVALFAVSACSGSRPASSDTATAPGDAGLADAAVSDGPTDVTVEPSDLVADAWSGPDTGLGEAEADAAAQDEAGQTAGDAEVNPDSTEGLPDAATEAATDGVADPGPLGDAPDVDAETVDLGGPEAEVAAVDASDDCTLDAVYPADGVTLLLDVGPLVKNPVVTGCGKGPPEPVAVGSGCCDCPLPYSCYCQGQCAWLRTPDLQKPQSQGQAVWTGKWVVTVAAMWTGAYMNSKQVWEMRVERWNPAAGDGFLAMGAGNPPLTVGGPTVLTTGGKVVMAMRGSDFANNGQFFSPAYLYDPEKDSYTTFPMPVCHDLTVAGKTLFCLQTHWDKPPGALLVYDSAAGTWSNAPFPSGVVPADGKLWHWGRTMSDSSAVYLYDEVDSALPWADGTLEKDVGHVLRYDVQSQAWTVVGTVPPGWRWADVTTWTVRNGAIVVSRMAPGLGMQSARLVLGGGWEFGSNTYIAGIYEGGTSRGVQVPCGIVFGSASWGYKTTNMYRPILIRDDLTIMALPPWGYFIDDKLGRVMGSYTASPTEFFSLGGENGTDAVAGYHRDGYRYPLSHICTGGNP